MISQAEMMGIIATEACEAINLPRKTLQELIAEEARSWKGTPFFGHQAIKGVGSDCVQTALAIFQNVGALPKDITLPQYRLSDGHQINDSIIIAWLSCSTYFSAINESPDMGDLVTMKWGRVEHHVGVMTGKLTFIQATERYGVVERDLRDSTWSKILRSTWRLRQLCSEAQMQ